MEESSVHTRIEAILFYKNEPVSREDLASFLGVSIEDIDRGLIELTKTLSSRGIRLIQHKDSVSLVTAPEYSDLIEKITKEELKKDLTEASLETLSIVCYKGPVTRKEIEYIRGVNSSMSLRTLLIRGLIERVPSKLDERIYLYSPTTDTLAYLGIGSLTELPSYERMQKELHAVETTE
jgi:segregation and condensation protein B